MNEIINEVHGQSRNRQLVYVDDMIWRNIEEETGKELIKWRETIRK